MARKTKKKRVVQKARSLMDVDRRVAANIRRLRLERGMSQESLAAEIRTSFQQLQKYETGTNRITIGRLVAICHALGISLDEITN
jgi:transcriptional regulator with XRE-family HTH domain